MYPVAVKQIWKIEEAVSEGKGEGSAHDSGVTVTAFGVGLGLSGCLERI
jgi:hypothetical protein